MLRLSIHGNRSLHRVATSLSGLRHNLIEFIERVGRAPVQWTPGDGDGSRLTSPQSVIYEMCVSWPWTSSWKTFYSNLIQSVSNSPGHW